MQKLCVLDMNLPWGCLFEVTIGGSPKSWKTPKAMRPRNGFSVEMFRWALMWLVSKCAVENVHAWPLQLGLNWWFQDLVSQNSLHYRSHGVSVPFVLPRWPCCTLSCAELNLVLVGNLC